MRQERLQKGKGEKAATYTWLEGGLQCCVSGMKEKKKKKKVYKMTLSLA